jgi:hypothetical protein
MRLPDFPHRRRVGTIQWAAIIWLRELITFGEGRNEVAFNRRRIGFAQSGKFQFPAGKRGGRRKNHGEVDMRATRECDTPMRHRAVGIEAHRFLKRADCGTVVEAEKKSQALVKIFLCEG